MKGTLSELHRRGNDVQRKGLTNNFIHFLIDSLWRDPVTGGNGREVELSTSAGYVVWRYVGETVWNNLFLIPADGDDGDDGAPGAPGTDGDDGREVELRTNAGYVEWRYVGEATWTQLYLIPTPAADTSIKVAIDFVSEDALEFVYKCPQAMKFTSQESENDDAVVSPAFNTNLTQYQPVTITASGVGLIVLIGEIV